MDVIWAFPVLLLGIALGTALAVGGLKIGPLDIAGGSLWIPILIIGVVYVPYMARPIRGEVLALREKEFVEAAVAQGAGPLRVMFGELLPNLVSTIIVFFTLNIANNMLLEAALSFLGAGVQPPNSSWGTMIADGYQNIYTAPLLTIVPGVMILLTVLSLNVFGDGLRDALDPSEVRQDPRWTPSRRARLMARFIARRLVGMVAVLFAVSVLVFLIFNVIPNSDPAQRIAGKNANPRADRQHRTRNWGFDQSLPVQYLTMMKKIFTGDLISYASSQNVDEQIVEGLPATFSLCIGAAVIWMFFGDPLRLPLRRPRRRKFTDRALTILSLVGISMPVFWLAAILLYYLTFKTEIFPHEQLRAADQEPARMGLSPDPALDHAGDPLTSASTAACCAPTCST